VQVTAMTRAELSTADKVDELRAKLPRHAPAPRPRAPRRHAPARRRRHRG
jgi:hypothetical protein